MSGKKVSRLVTGAVLIALGCVSAQAEPVKAEKQKTSKEVKTGMIGGTIVGALVGGPIGAAVGFIIGATSGGLAQTASDSKVFKVEQKLATAELQLADTGRELVAAQAALAAASAQSGDPMVSQLAQRLHADVLFRTKSAELDPASASKLADLGAIIASFPGLVIEIDGYADPRGKAGENLELSQQRASAVRAALMIGGAASDSIRIAAHGEQLSTAPKDDMDAYAWERRVSLSVVPADAKAADTQVAKAQ
jgi:outer membrane protein OmpA-like peptidoglycan-associated protein